MALKRLLQCQTIQDIKGKNQATITNKLQVPQMGIKVNRVAHRQLITNTPIQMVTRTIKIDIQDLCIHNPTRDTNQSMIPIQKSTVQDKDIRKVTKQPHIFKGRARTQILATMELNIPILISNIIPILVQTKTLGSISHQKSRSTFHTKHRVTMMWKPLLAKLTQRVVKQCQQAKIVKDAQCILLPRLQVTTHSFIHREITISFLNGPPTVLTYTTTTQRKVTRQWAVETSEFHSI